MGKSHKCFGGIQVPMYEIMQKKTFGSHEAILCENHTKRLVAAKHFCAKIT